MNKNDSGFMVKSIRRTTLGIIFINMFITFAIIFALGWVGYITVKAVKKDGLKTVIEEIWEGPEKELEE